jgi:alpha-2-macroglobulin
LANRFKPVVKVLGPFLLGKGQKAVHNITLPNYVGSVRAMVTMSDNGAYGAAEKAVAVRKPVMVFATLPRVLSPTEKLSLPVEIFAMEDKVKDVTVTVQEESGLIDFGGNTTKTINFTQTGSKMVNFDLNVADKLGIAKFKITAKGGGETATQEVELDIRNPNPFITNVQSVVLEGGQNQNFPVNLIGASGTNKAILEISNIPPLNLGKRLEYLLQYPHGCVEQTTSAGFPQLYADKLIQLNDEQRRRATDNVKATIESLRNFQNSYGGMGYWRGDNAVSHWGTNYAGHFLLEAKNMGYTMPVGLLDKWKKYQKDAAKKWDIAHDDSGFSGEGAALNQAYRLYTLALAGDPETGAMNRLREQKDLSDAAKWRLAAAYALTGKPEIAKELMQKSSRTAKTYIELADTYGSTLRDQAMLLETLTLMGDKTAAISTIQDISNALSSDNWYNTQATAYALMAVSKFVGNTGVNQNYNFSYKMGNQASTNVTATRPIVQIAVPANQLTSGASIAINNTAKTPLFARLISSGQPAVGDQNAGESNLKMSVVYKTLDGKPLDITSIKQGTDFLAEVSVTNTGSRAMDYKEMALTQTFPPCWEIHNARMTGVQSGVTASSPADYQDIRDNRVYTYFDLPRGKTHTYRVQLNAAYTGRYYLPTVGCEAMYDNTIAARAAGKWVSVL